MSLSDHFEKSRKIFLFSSINRRSARQFIKMMRYLADISSDPIYVYINSPGGDVSQQEAILDEVRGTIARGIEVYLIGQGEICSAAAFILTMGAKGYRYMTEHSIYMTHHSFSSVPDDYIHQQSKYVDFINKKETLDCKRLAKACGKTVKKIEEDIKVGLWLTAKEAVRYGAVDGIWDFKQENVCENSNE